MAEWKEKRYKCSLEELKIRIKKLVITDEIINSELEDDEKLDKLLKMFNNSETFRKSYSLLIKFGENDDRLDLISDLLDNFDHYLNEFKRLESVRFVKNKEEVKQDLLDNYDYAKRVITLYIESSESYKDTEFLRILELNQKEFDYCVEIIKKLDSDLYSEYLAKKEENNRIRSIKNRETFSNLSNGIKTGKLEDGTNFDLLEFIKRVPFKRSNDFMGSLVDFLTRFNLSDRKTILRYVYANGMNNHSFFAPLDKKYFYRTKITLNGVEVTSEHNDMIFEYIHVNNIPCIYTTYKIVRERVINGEITPEIIAKQRECYENKLKEEKKKSIKKTLKMSDKKEE